MKQSLKQVLIETILSCGNNPYPNEKMLKTMSDSFIQILHDDLMLSRGKPIKKLTEAELENWRERQFD